MFFVILLMVALAMILRLSTNPGVPANFLPHLPKTQDSGQGPHVWLTFFIFRSTILKLCFENLETNEKTRKSTTLTLCHKNHELFRGNEHRDFGMVLDGSLGCVLTPGAFEASWAPEASREAFCTPRSLGDFPPCGPDGRAWV